MKLDSRIIEGKKPLTCFDTEEARKFEGEQGYFSDNPLNFAYGDMALSKTTVLGELRLNEDNLKYPFLNTTNSINYRFFLPVAWLKPEEPKKKYRPYSIAEFLKLYQVGDIVEFRNKNCDEFYRAMFIGYITNSNRSMDEKPGEIDVMLGNYLYSLSHLFEDHELFFEDKWQPFGVEGEE